MIFVASAGFVSIGKSGWSDFPGDSAPLLTSAGIVAFGLGRIMTTFEEKTGGIPAQRSAASRRNRDTGMHVLM
jgi:hypothetical protein